MTSPCPGRTWPRFLPPRRPAGHLPHQAMAAVAVLVTWSLAACGTTGDVSVQTPVTPTAPGVQAATRDAGRGGS
ncbi:MAG: hypothetical protein WKF80_04955, partial [Thermomicrobiales bacterium]